MPTRVWDYLPEYESERQDILDAVETVFRSGQLVLGASVRSFEAEFAAYHGVRHCAGVDNGTNAIKLALQALGVGKGDEVDHRLQHRRADRGGHRRRGGHAGLRRRATRART